MLSESEKKIIHQTEKAFLLEISGGLFKPTRQWVPKSAVTPDGWVPTRFTRLYGSVKLSDEQMKKIGR